MATELWVIYKILTLLIEFSSYFTRIYMYKHHLLFFLLLLLLFGGGGVLQENYYDFIVCFMHIIDEFKVIKCEGHDFEATRNGRRYQTAWCVFYIVRTSGESI